VGSAVRASATHEYASGILETTQVDPGREYFFGFGRFVRNATTGKLELSGGGRLEAVTAFTHERVEIDDRAAFFDHESNRVSGEVGYLLGPQLTARARFEHERVPTPEDRPEAEAKISTMSLGLVGEVAPLVHALVFVGHQRHDAPRAGLEGRRYRGTYVNAAVRKEFTPTSFARLTATRTTHLSGFESNGFYVTEGASLDGGMEMPLYVVLHGAYSWQQNRYRIPAAGIGVPRKDRLQSWSLGAGRSLTRWAYARVDYRRDYRDSNLAAFRTDGHAFIVQLGIGFQSQVAPR
jgi:hypothetical protein